MTRPFTVAEKVATGVLGFIVLSGSAVATLPVFEPWLPATRYFARALVEAAKADQSDTTVGLLELKMIAFDGQLTTLEAQSNELDLKLIAEPNDRLLNDFKRKLGDDIDTLKRKRAKAAKEKCLIEFPNLASSC